MRDGRGVEEKVPRQQACFCETVSDPDIKNRGGEEHVPIVHRISLSTTFCVLHRFHESKDLT